MASNIKLSTLLWISFTIAQAQYFDYYYNGNDWPGTCQTGYFQSPIPLNKSTSISVPFKSDLSIQLYLSYVQLSIQGFFNSYSYILRGPWGYGISTNSTNDATLSKAVQIEFHSPAEHTIDGKVYDLEMQILHYDTSLKAYKFSILYELDESIKGNTQFFSQAISSADQPASIDLMDAFRDIQVIDNFYLYVGSNNIPPCTEGITWVVWSNPQPISRKDLDFFDSKWSKNKSFANGNGNNRLLNDQNGRFVFMYTGKDKKQDDYSSYLQFSSVLFIFIINLY